MAKKADKRFKDRHLWLYFRPRDGIYVIPDGIISGGRHFHVEPFEHVSLTASADEIWEAVLKTFPRANQVVPEPKVFTEDTAWFRKAGVKKWSQFAGKARRIMSVTETATDYVFKGRIYHDGVISSGEDMTLKISKKAPRAEIVAALDDFLQGP